MSIFTKQIISEKTILTWLVATTILTVLSLLVSSAIVFMTYDCWPLTRYQLSGNICLAQIEPDYIKFIPIAIGVIIGTAITLKLSRSNIEK